MRNLTQAQKKEIRILQQELVVKTDDRRRKQMLATLVRLGVVLHEFNTATYTLAAGWESRDLLDGHHPAVFEHEKDVPDGPSTASRTRAPYSKAPIPDPPKKISRPPAIYSNRSHQEHIDHILKNY